MVWRSSGSLVKHSVLGQTTSSMLRCTSDHLFSSPGIVMPGSRLPSKRFEDGVLRAEQEQLWHVQALVASYRELKHHQQAIRLLRQLPGIICTGQEWSIAIVWLAGRGRQGPMESEPEPEPGMEGREDKLAAPTALLSMFSLGGFEDCRRIDSRNRDFLSSFQSISAHTSSTNLAENKRCADTVGKIGWRRGRANKVRR